MKDREEETGKKQQINKDLYRSKEKNDGDGKNMNY